ncbi:ProQ/FinO family protein [Cupriavidus sp. 30B13]|uniref:ProQ/FinO family protein n=1 Tax=Cupriavidus sp. 30B13 TaxID=3384241 RepID=UPI003CEF76A0
MGFEQLAALKQQLAAQAKEAKGAKGPAEGKERREARPAREAKDGKDGKDGGKRKSAPRPERKEPVDPVVESIWRLQRHFPRAFPKNPAPKLPLKQGILDDAAQQLDTLGLTREQLQQAIAAWCQGSRYWACLVDGAARVDLQGNPVGSVTTDQAARARRQGARRAPGRARGGRPGGARAAAGAQDSGAAANAPAPAEAPVTAAAPASADTPAPADGA